MNSKQHQSCSSSLDDCLRLLRDERDDSATLRTVSNAVGIRFLDRMLRGTMGKARDHNLNSYLQLFVTVLATFCRVPEIAFSEVMVSKIPLILEFMSESASLVSPESFLVLRECYEYLYLVVTSGDRGFMAFYNSGGLKVLASHMPKFPDGSHIMELAMKIAHFVLSKLHRDINSDGYSSELLIVVTAIARQSAVLHAESKHEVLRVLSDIFSSESVHDALQEMESSHYSVYIRAGIMSALQDFRLKDRFPALNLAESMVSIFGEMWLVSPEEQYIPSDKSLLLVLVSSGLKINALLHELTRLKREDSENTMISEEIIQKQHNVAAVFSLVQTVMKLMSAMEEPEVREGSVLTGINRLDETVYAALNYLEDAKEHGENRGYDLLACVRFVGSYFAEATEDCRERVEEMMEYLMKVEGEDEEEACYSPCFLLPVLCQLF